MISIHLAGLMQMYFNLFIDGCRYGIEVDGNSDLPNESSGNTFHDIQVQCRQQTKSNSLYGRL